MRYEDHAHPLAGQGPERLEELDPLIGGDAGANLGDAASNVTIFIRGQAASLAEGVFEAPLRQKEQVRLGLLLINASIRGDATDFRRVVPEAMLEAEQSKSGELNPNWR